MRQARPTLSTARKAKGNTELKEPYLGFPKFFCFTTNIIAVRLKEEVSLKQHRKERT